MEVFIYHIKSPILFFPLLKYDYAVKWNLDLISQCTQGTSLTNDRANVHRAACVGNGEVSLVTLPDQYKTFHFTERTYLLCKLSQSKALNWILPLKRAGQ